MTRIFDDTTMKAIQFALSGVNQRQQATAHNIANINTPGFQSGRIQFEDQLAEALRTGKAVDGVAITRQSANTPVNTRGNDVALEEESQILIESGVQYEALVNAMNYKLTVLRSAIGGT